MNTIIKKNPNHIIILYQKKINQTWGVMLELITDRDGEPAGRYEGGPDCHPAQWRPHGELEMISPAGRHNQSCYSHHLQAGGRMGK